jgi:N-acyl homoserine lactone hydrolase
MAKVETVLQGFSLGTDQGNLAFCGVTLIEGSKRILVDVAHNGRRTLLLDRLKERGLTPDDIDYIFLTHSHWDHMLNIDLFPNAKVMLHPVEREYAKQPLETDWATPAYATLILESRQIEEVRGGDELDDGVSVIETPGHSRGSMALLVKDGNDTIAISGDALPNALSLQTGNPRLVFWNADEARASIRKLLDTANVFYPGHDRPFRVGDVNAVTYLQTTGLRLFGLPEPGPGDEGLSITYGMGNVAAAEAAQQRT